mmetsp:Transcript_18519/g.65519  ORF Transcript_18519/g.65519 Transcript_18519/m.65519 type:complete len:222 (-) Transcript_18519:522-1187(-)
MFRPPGTPCPSSFRLRSELIDRNRRMTALGAAAPCGAPCVGEPPPPAPPTAANGSPVDEVGDSGSFLMLVECDDAALGRLLPCASMVRCDDVRGSGSSATGPPDVRRLTSSKRNDLELRTLPGDINGSCRMRRTDPPRVEPPRTEPPSPFRIEPRIGVSFSIGAGGRFGAASRRRRSRDSCSSRAMRSRRRRSRRLKARAAFIALVTRRCTCAIVLRRPRL